jgi:hypothetical protein
VFGHVLAYLRDGVVAVGHESDVSLLRRMQRECGFYCLELVEEQDTGCGRTLWISQSIKCGAIRSTARHMDGVRAHA